MMNAEGTKAFGEFGAGSVFNIQEFIKKPQVFLRILSLFFSLIVFSLILSQGWEKDQCKFNDSPSTCNYGVFVSVSAFILSIIFIGIDYLFTTISNVIQRKYIVIADIILSAVWCFFYFSSFCNLVDKWRNTEDNIASLSPDACRATIVFTFFSIPCFAGLTYLAISRYRQGITDLATQYNNSDSYDQGFAP